MGANKINRPPSEDGQIKTEDEKNRTIELDCGTIETTDFSTPYLDEDRFKEAFPKSQNKSKKATEKRERTRQAYDKTLSRFNKTPTDEQDKWIPYE